MDINSISNFCSCDCQLSAHINYGFDLTDRLGVSAYVLVNTVVLFQFCVISIFLSFTVVHWVWLWLKCVKSTLI